MRAGLAEQVEEIVSWELSEQVRLQSTKDFKEGIKASLERRNPKFEGS
jgi:enoyl-CoA hydratase/carnithine racemase